MGLTNFTHVGLKWVEFGLGSNHPDPSAAPATNIFFPVNVDAVSASAHSFFSWAGMTLRDPPVHAPAQARVKSQIPTNVKCFLPWWCPPHSNCFTATFGLHTRISHSASVAGGLRPLPIITVNMQVNILLIFLFLP